MQQFQSQEMYSCDDVANDGMCDHQYPECTESKCVGTDIYSIDECVAICQIEGFKHACAYHYEGEINLWCVCCK